MRNPRPFITAEDAPPGQLLRGSLRLLAMLICLVLLVVPLIRDLPLGQSTRTGILAWLLVGLALYWLYAGMGYRPLLLLQLLLFSIAAVLLSTKLLLVGLGVRRFTVLRWVARALIMVGTALAGVNLAAMAFALLRRRDARPPGVAS